MVTRNNKANILDYTVDDCFMFDSTNNVLLSKSSFFNLLTFSKL